MKMDKNAESLKKQLEPFFKKREEINFAYLFGSSAVGTSNSLSDIDIAVSVEKNRLQEGNYPYGYAAHLTSLLMHQLKTNRIDVTLFDEAAPALKHRIFTQGIPVFRRNRDQEMEAFVKTLQQYQDTAPLRRIQQFYLQRYLRNLGPASSRG